MSNPEVTVERKISTTYGTDRALRETLTRIQRRASQMTARALEVDYIEGDSWYHGPEHQIVEVGSQQHFIFGIIPISRRTRKYVLRMAGDVSRKAMYLDCVLFDKSILPIVEDEMKNCAQELGISKVKIIECYT